MKKISLIVPVWNVENYIEDCLKSLVNQTLEDIEIIVVNDGSPDNSQKIIDKYVKKYPRKVKSYIKENGGQGSARNLGLKYANGEYIGFIDSDDYLDKHFAKEMYELGKKENADVVVCDMIDKYLDKEIYRDVTNFKEIYMTTPSVCNKLFKSEVLNTVEFLSKYWYEDLNFMYKIYSKLNKIAVIHKGYYICNCRELSTMTNNNSLKNLDILYVIEDAKKWLKNNKLYNEEVYNYLVFDHILITTINRVEMQKNKDKRIVINKIINYCKKNIKLYKKCYFYKNISKNRKIVAWLNYHHLSKISKILINIKKGR